MNLFTYNLQKEVKAFMDYPDTSLGFDLNDAVGQSYPSGAKPGRVRGLSHGVNPKKVSDLDYEMIRMIW